MLSFYPLEFTLHFTAARDMIAHLTSADSNAGSSVQSDAGRTSGLPAGETITCADGNAPFSLKENEDKPVVLRRPLKRRYS